MPSPMAGYILEVYLSHLEAEKNEKKKCDRALTKKKTIKPRALNVNLLDSVFCVCGENKATQVGVLRLHLHKSLLYCGQSMFSNISVRGRHFENHLRMSETAETPGTL